MSKETAEMSDVEIAKIEDASACASDDLPKDDLDILLFRYPGIAADKSPRGDLILRGNVKIKDTWYYLQLSCPFFPTLEALTLKVHEVHEVKTYTASSPGFDSNWTVFEVIESLPNIVGDRLHLSSSTSITNSHLHNYYLEIASLYAPDQYQIQLNALTTRLRFAKFTDYEQHYLELELQPRLRIISHSLPDCVVREQELLQKCPTITSLLQQFRKYFDDLQEFYENIHEIDELCYVLQPTPSSTKDNWRLFLLRKGVFLKLIIADPFVPTASMSMHIIGPTNEVEQLRRTYSEGLRDWDSELKIHKNLIRIFDLCFFPMPSEKDESISEQCCKICFDYQLENGEIPLVSCDNKRCAVIYHPTCLKKWFNTLTDGKVFLDVSFGECPFCKAKLSTSFAELLKH